MLTLNIGFLIGCLKKFGSFRLWKVINVVPFGEKEANVSQNACNRKQVKTNNFIYEEHQFDETDCSTEGSEFGNDELNEETEINKETCMRRANFKKENNFQCVLKIIFKISNIFNLSNFQNNETTKIIRVPVYSKFAPYKDDINKYPASVTFRLRRQGSGYYDHLVIMK